MKAAVTKQAVIQRVNRVLKKQNAKLCKNRRANTSELGEYFVVKNNTIYPEYKHVDVEKLARKLEALSEYEKMED